MKNISKRVDLSSIFQVKRAGADADDMFWSYGKIHGLENIAFCDLDEVKATNGNPILLQQLINKVNGPSVSFGSHEELVAATNKKLDEYKKIVNEMGLSPSDRKKLLSLPFYMAKRRELPEPK